MSYILDALRRADAERERGAVPHLHTQAVPATRPEAEGARGTRPWGWLAAGLALGLLAALGWALGGGREAAPMQAQAPAADAAPNAVPASAVTGASTASASERALASTSITSTSNTPSIVPRSLPTAPSPVDMRPETPAATAPPRAAVAALTRREAPASAATASAAARSEPAVATLAELPADVRRELPQLTIGGSMYSQNAGSRMLIVNGQLMREGDAVSPTVTLEQIRLRSAVLRYKTWRYEIGF